MLTKINRQTCLLKYPLFPQTSYNDASEEFDCFYPDTASHYILTVPSKSFRGHITLLGKELAKLGKAFEFDSLVFLGDSQKAWLFRAHDYAPVKRAQQFLKDHKLGKRFNGALQVPLNDLPVFIRHLSWLVTCNGVIPYIYFTDTAQTIVGTICQYGNIHISMVNKSVDLHFNRLLKLTTFKKVKKC